MVRKLIVLLVLLSALAYIGPLNAAAAPDCNDCPGNPADAGHSPSCAYGSPCYGCWASCRYSSCNPFENQWQCSCPDSNPACFS